MTRYLLDTQVIINFWKAKKRWIDFIKKHPQGIGTSVICVAELFEGVFLGKRSREEKEKIENFINDLEFISEVDRKVAEEFAEIRAFLRKEGSLIEDFDILIAASCIVDNLTLVTENKRHFSKIKNLKIF